MLKVYLDCDGVILDTINKSSQMLKEEGIYKEPEITHFYSSIDWKKLIEDSGEINYAISKIKELIKYFDIEILTHVNSDREIKEKIEYFAKELPGTKVITVPKTIQKADYVNPKNAVLVDDYSSNLEYWKEKGGIPIKFSHHTHNYTYPVIEDLSELIELLNEIKVK